MIVGQPIFPIKAGLIVTNRCIYQCKHCYVSSNEVKYSELGTRTWLDIIDKLEEAGIFEIYVGGGEPFLRSDIYSILQYALEKKLDVGTSTNAALLNAEKAKNIPEDVHIQVSLDGINEMHEAIRGKGTYLLTMKGIKALLKSGRGITIATTINHYNYDYLPIIYEFISKLGIRSWYLIRPMPCGRAIRNWGIFNLSNKEWINCVRRFKRISKTDDSIKLSIDKTFDTEEMRCIESSNADMFWADIDEICVLPNGNLVTCDLLMHEHKYIIGNILNVSNLRKLWEDSPIIKGLLRCINKIRGKCKDCQFFYICKGGSRYVAEKLLNDIYAPDPMCPHEPPNYISYDNS